MIEAMEDMRLLLLLIEIKVIEAMKGMWALLVVVKIRLKPWRR
jgi:hypothetical protein